MLGLLITIGLLWALMKYWRKVKITHDARIRKIPVRIHVNGIRGKSTVTRLIAGVLREGGYRTIGKTTGSAARIIFEDGSEKPIERQGAPTILEQIDVIEKYASEDHDAIVIECMAVNPVYQNISQHKIVQANITVITNVREDHQDVMGDSLPQIAEALSNTIPKNGTLIIAEENLEIRQQLIRNAKKNNTNTIYADPNLVSEEDLSKFDYLAFKENLAIGFRIAEFLGIPREVALNGMLRARPDLGAVSVRKIERGGKEIIWAPLFAVNDRESTIISINALRSFHDHDATRIGILNNRHDRPVRANKFAEIAAIDLKLDYYFLFGAYQNQIAKKMVELGYPWANIIAMGSNKKLNASDFIDSVMNLIRDKQALLVGLVNIHTPQAEKLSEFFQAETDESPLVSNFLAQTEHISTSAKRDRYSIRHLVKK